LLDHETRVLALEPLLPPALPAGVLFTLPFAAQRFLLVRASTSSQSPRLAQTGQIPSACLSRVTCSGITHEHSDAKAADRLVSVKQELWTLSKEVFLTTAPSHVKEKVSSPIRELRASEMGQGPKRAAVAAADLPLYQRRRSLEATALYSYMSRELAADDLDARVVQRLRRKDGYRYCLADAFITGQPEVK
jgi:hypothetical protein